MGYIIKNGVRYIVYNGLAYGGLGGDNFKVIGSTVEPTSPTENTIWVETDTTISSFIFSVYRPNTVSEGMVWFKTSSRSSVSFNAIVNNYLEVNPVMCQQYINDEWVMKDTKTYQNGEWIGWSTHLYYLGEVNTALTGGLTPFAYRPSTSGSSVEMPSFVENGSSMTISNSDDSLAGTAGVLFSENPIDVTGFNKMCCEVLEIECEENGAYIRCGVAETKSNNFIVTKAQTMRSTGIFQVDLSTLTGEYYPHISLYGSYKKSVTISRWWLE